MLLCGRGQLEQVHYLVQSDDRESKLFCQRLAAQFREGEELFSTFPSKYKAVHDCPGFRPSDCRVPGVVGGPQSQELLLTLRRVQLTEGKLK